MPKTGATRYQKFLKSEKGKTKLKTKKDKELPKGTNVTKTNFKVKKIVIKEQLKKHEKSEVLSTRKLNIKELLLRLRHFNIKSRIDALDGISELITSRTEVLEQNLGQLIHGVTPLVLNIEKSVRQETLKVMHLILSNTSMEKIIPFYDIMSTYLRSAMTHIDNRIQEDSLLFLDVLLLCTSNLVIEDFHRILPNFLDMISKLRVDSKPGRTLTVNLDSKVTSVKWRVKVLYRLQDFLQKFVELRHIQNRYQSSFKPPVFYNEKKTNYYPLRIPVYTSNCHVSCFTTKNYQEIENHDEVDKFKSYIALLMPLLFETWLEVCPIVDSLKNIETVITEDAAKLLKHLIIIISLLFDVIKYLDTKDPSSKMLRSFCKNYYQLFTQHFINSFPYVISTRQKQIKSSSFVDQDIITDPKLTVENLKICQLYIVFSSFVNLNNQKAEISSILSYIEKSFDKNTEGEVGMTILDILTAIFSDEINSWTRNTSVVDSLYRKIIRAYFNKDMPALFLERIFILLCEIALNHNLNIIHKCDDFEKWLESLPDILLNDTISVQTVSIVHKFAICNNVTFNRIMSPKLLRVIENLPTIKVSDCDVDSNGYHKLFSLLNFVKRWDNDSLNLLENQLLNNVYKSDHGKYIFETLKLRSSSVKV